MKKLLISIGLILSLTGAQAATWYSGGILYGNVCRSGFFYTVNPFMNGQPVGSTCPVRDVFGNFVTWGTVSYE